MADKDAQATPSPIEGLAKAICAKHRTAVHGEDADERTILLAWQSHIPEARAALQWLHDNVSEEEIIHLAVVMLALDEETEEEWAFNLLKMGFDMPHMGDCTNEPISCSSCITDDWTAKARTVRSEVIKAAMKET